MKIWIVQWTDQGDTLTSYHPTAMDARSEMLRLEAEGIHGAQWATGGAMEWRSSLPPVESSGREQQDHRLKTLLEA